jgi:hypothetical protein
VVVGWGAPLGRVAKKREKKNKKRTKFGELAEIQMNLKSAKFWFRRW